MSTGVETRKDHDFVQSSSMVCERTTGRIKRMFVKFAAMLTIWSVSCCHVSFGSDTGHTGMLRLIDGDVFRGHFATQPLTNSPEDSNSEPHVNWNCKTFLDPLSVPWTSVDSISFHSTNEATLPNTGTQSDLFIIELSNGDCLTGEIEEIQPDFVRIRSKRFPTQSIALGAVRAILRVVDGHAGGKLSPSEWKQIVPAVKGEADNRWVPKVGSIETEIAGTSISQNKLFPSMSSIDLDIAWTHSSPNWTLAVGGKLPKLELRVRKLDQRDDLSVTLLLEEETAADITTVLLPFRDMESIRLRVFCDFDRGRFALQHNGKTVGEIVAKNRISTSEPQRVVLTNDAPGGLILRELKVARSVFLLGDSDQQNQEGIGEAEYQQATLLLKQGDVLVGRVAEQMPASRGVRWIDVQGEKRDHLWENIERMEFAAKSRKTPSKYLWPDIVRSNNSACTVQLVNGERFTGESLKQVGGTLEVFQTSLQRTLTISLAEVSTIQFQRTDLGNVGSKQSSNESTPRQPVPMKLHSDDSHSSGRIVGDKNHPQGDQSWFWKTQNLKHAVRLDASINGVIDMLQTQEMNSAEKPGSILRTARTSTYGRSLIEGEPALFLANGDSLPGQLKQLRNGKVSFQSKLFGDSAIDASQIKGIRQLAYTGWQAIDPSVLNRLLTIPRMMRSDPPQHLVISRDGDILRGNVLSLDEDHIRMEVRGEERNVWMKNIAEIIWLDPVPYNSKESESPKSVLDGKPQEVKTSEPSLGPRCQILTRLGARLSVVPASVDGSDLLGLHPLLGQCRLEVSDCSRILFGEEIQRSLESSQFSRWKLRHAIDPKFVAEAEEADGTSQSKLVGQTAPDFDIEKLDGNRLKLSSLKGRVVMVDFWASWCGPCRKSLPLIQQLANDFAQDELAFVAINMGEDHNVARGMATLLGISSDCAMDANGSVAKAYDVKSIPHTVLIDRDGIVRHVVIGTNDEAFVKLRNVISDLISTPAK